MGEDGAVAGDGGGVPVEAERSGEPEPDLDAALPDPARAPLGRVGQDHGLGPLRPITQVGKVEHPLVGRRGRLVIIGATIVRVRAVIVGPVVVRTVGTIVVARVVVARVVVRTLVVPPVVRAVSSGPRSSAPWPCPSGSRPSCEPSSGSGGVFCAWYSAASSSAMARSSMPAVEPVEHPHPDLQAQLVDRGQHPEVADRGGERVDAGLGGDALGGGRVAERQRRGA